ncbi:hypothetical protein GCM10011532_33200 [Christiangramia forsetii]|uniref:Carboxypeptidase-like regulatory domain-containing protein n=1 Tax=Christiangramia forsetii TaxID=411153 RepID=A0ABQ1WY09_9FLAO|nr:hypothetical protein GCM10011532_33200 [Christiangramia forsetii]
MLDQETRKPIEYVDIYNDKDYTSTNEEGKFLFVSKEDSLKIGILGYEQKFTTFQLQKNDTILLRKKIQDLDEVVINSDSNLFKSVLKKLDKNYPLEEYKEKFFLRSVLKRNDKIIKLVDFSGKIERKTLFSTKSNPMPKKNYFVEIENLRKAGIKEENIEFTLSSFEELFNSFITIYMSPEIYDFKLIPFKDSKFVKLEFHPNSSKKGNSSGYYLVNLEDKAFNEVHISNSQKTDYIDKKELKYRTTNYDVNITFKKDPGSKKYFIDKASMSATVEVVPDKADKIIYTVNYKLYTFDNFQDFEIKSNINLSKDIFDLKESYDQSFWESQNYLLLTKEMQEFLSSLNNENNDFKSATNIKS